MRITHPTFQACSEACIASRPSPPTGDPMLSLISKRTGERMPTKSLQHMPLTSAYLCQDCNSIGNCARQCPACASEVLMGLAGVLNREVEDAVQPNYSYVPALVA